MISLSCGRSMSSHVLFFSIVLISSSIAFLQISSFTATSKLSGSIVMKLQVSYISWSDLVLCCGSGETSCCIDGGVVVGGGVIPGVSLVFSLHGCVIVRLFLSTFSSSQFHDVDSSNSISQLIMNFFVMGL